MRFADRRAAGRELARLLSDYAGRTDAIVLALPRGGVPVGYEIAEKLGIPLDVFIVRKIGMPGHEELAIGAIASGGIRVLNDAFIDTLDLPPAVLEAIIAREEREIERRQATYRDNRPEPELAGRTVILVDDGLATGSTMRAAVRAVRACDPARIIVAVPTAASEACGDLESEADEVVCAITPPGFSAVGEWYDDFAQTSDDEVRVLLARSRERV